MNQDNPNTLNYADPLAAPGVEIFPGEGLHVRFSPVIKSWFWQKIFPPIGQILFGTGLIIATLIFPSVYDPALLWIIMGAIAMTTGIYWLVSVCREKQAQTFKIFVDDTQIRIARNGRECPAIAQSGIRDLWIKTPLLSISMNIEHKLCILTDDALFECEITTHRRVNMGHYGALFRKMLNLTQTTLRQMKIVKKRKYL